MAKLGTYADVQQEEVVATQETPSEQNTEVNNDEATISTDVVTDANVSSETKAAEVSSEQSTQTIAQEDFSTSVDFTIEDETKTETTQQVVAEQPKELTIDDAIAKFGLKDLLAKAGISEFALEIDQHIKNGGKGEDYLIAKSVDYTKVSHAELVMEDLKKQYPTLSSDKLEKLYRRKYSLTDEALDEDRELGEIQLEADGEALRQRKIAEQQKFKIAEPHQVNIEEEVKKVLQYQEAERNKNIEKEVEYFNNHAATKSLLESKRVVSKYGENGAFNFQLDKPEMLMKVITDGETWAKVTSKEGEPNVELLQEIALFALNPLKFKTALVNHGKALGAKGLIDEGKNALKGGNVVPMNAHQDKPVYRQSQGMGGR